VRRFEGEHGQVASQLQGLREQMRIAGEALEVAGFRPLERADPKALRVRVSEELRGLESARAAQDRLVESRKTEKARPARDRGGGGDSAPWPRPAWSIRTARVVGSVLSAAGRG
jgi:hypothetical protein